jgi:hypothetical protein
MNIKKDNPNIPHVSSLPMHLSIYKDRLKSSWTHLITLVGILWRCSDGLFFQVPPLASDALLTTLHPLFEKVLQTNDHFKISCLGAPFSWFEKPRNCMGQVCTIWQMF